MRLRFLIFSFLLSFNEQIFRWLFNNNNNDNNNNDTSDFDKRECTFRYRKIFFKVSLCFTHTLNVNINSNRIR